MTPKTIKFSDDELAFIKEQCEIYNLDFSKYIKSLVSQAQGGKQHHTITAEQAELLKAFYTELKKQGTNLNQIAKAMNERRHDDLKSQDFLAFCELNIALQSLILKIINNK